MLPRTELLLVEPLPKAAAMMVRRTLKSVPLAPSRRRVACEPRPSYVPDDLVHGSFGQMHLKTLLGPMSVKNRDFFM